MCLSFHMTFNFCLSLSYVSSQSIHWEQPKQQVLPLSGQEVPQTRADGGVSSLEEFRKGLLFCPPVQTVDLASSSLSCTGSTVKPTSLLSKFRNNEDLT